ncbi:MAG: hypothetical protein Q8M07_24900 [Prosthecobacter sp.]|nr:hypothetical protein [Prosthecobacter sp.]
MSHAKITKHLANQHEASFGVSDFNVDIRDAHPTASTSDLTEAFTLQGFIQWIFNLISPSKMEVRRLQNDLEEGGLWHEF